MRLQNICVFQFKLFFHIITAHPNVYTNISLIIHFLNIKILIHENFWWILNPFFRIIFTTFFSKHCILYSYGSTRCLLYKIVSCTPWWTFFVPCMWQPQSGDWSPDECNSCIGYSWLHNPDTSSADLELSASIWPSSFQMNILNMYMHIPVSMLSWQ